MVSDTLAWWPAGRFRPARLGLRRSFRFGLAPRLRDGLGGKTLRQVRTPCGAIPLLEGLSRDRALDQQLGKLPALRFALDWHQRPVITLRIRHAAATGER